MKLATFYGPIAVVFRIYMKDMYAPDSPAVFSALYRFKEVKGWMQKAFIMPIQVIRSSLFKRYSVTTFMKAFLKTLGIWALDRPQSFKASLGLQKPFNQCSRLRYWMVLLRWHWHCWHLCSLIFTSTQSIYTAPLLNMILIKPNTLKSGLQFHNWLPKISCPFI